MEPARRLALQIAGKSADEEDDDLTDPDDGSEQDDDQADDDGTAEIDRDEADEALKGFPEDAFADEVLVPLFQTWQRRSKDQGAPWPARFPTQLHPLAHESPGKFAARVAAYYRRRPEAADAFRAVGEEPEWTDYVTGAMRLSKGAAKAKAKPAGGPDATPSNGRPGAAGAPPRAAGRPGPAGSRGPAPNVGSRRGGDPGGARGLRGR